MKHFRKTTLSLRASMLLLAAAAAMVFGGCESADSHVISISPNYAEVNAAKQRIALTAQGYNDYTWSLANNEIGSLNASTGESVVYTAHSVPPPGGEHAVQTVYVTARATGTSATYKGSAKIRHNSQGGTTPATTSGEDFSGGLTGGGSAETPSGGGNGGSGSNGYTTLAVSPATGRHTTLGNFTVLEISPVEGFTYRWTLSDPTLGQLSSTTGTKVTYRTLLIPTSGSRSQTITVTGTSTSSSTRYRGTSTITHAAP